MLQIFRSNIITLALAICFCTASYFFLTAYNRYDISRGKVEVMETRVRLLKQQKREAQRKWRILTRVNAFVDKAASLGLEGKKWANYDVNIQEPVTFFEMEQILNQCSNSSSYYFKPIALHANISPESDGKIVKKTSTSNSADSRKSKEGDLMLTLRGAFIVRQ